MPRSNKDYVRKRKPMKLTMEDLEPENDDDDDDNEWRNKDKTNRVGWKLKLPTLKAVALQIKTREMPCRNAKRKAIYVLD
jgi:hypothetical protein